MAEQMSMHNATAIGAKMRGMYGRADIAELTAGTGSIRSRGGGTANAASARSGEAGVVSGRRIRVGVQTPGRVRTLGRLITLRGVLLSMLALIISAAAVILMTFNFEKSVIYGNTKYSQEQIESFITRGHLGENTFVMALKFHNRKVRDIPFVDRIDIDIISPSTVRVNIKEKPLDGCIYYKKKNVYFSKEGMIETVSGRDIENVTRINGVVLTHSTEGKQVLAKNQLGLDLSLSLLREMDKYGIHADSIEVDDRSAITAVFGDVRVKLGKSGFEQKMYKIHQILPDLAGRSGTIYMNLFEKNYADIDVVLTPDSVYETADERKEALRKEKEEAERKKAEKARKKAEKEAKKKAEEQAARAAQAAAVEAAAAANAVSEVSAVPVEESAQPVPDTVAAEGTVQPAADTVPAEETAQPAPDTAPAEEAVQPAADTAPAEEAAQPAPDTASAEEAAQQVQQDTTPAAEEVPVADAGQEG